MGESVSATPIGFTLMTALRGRSTRPTCLARPACQAPARH